MYTKKPKKLYFACISGRNNLPFINIVFVLKYVKKFICKINNNKNHFY